MMQQQGFFKEPVNIFLPVEEMKKEKVKVSRPYYYPRF